MSIMDAISGLLVSNDNLDIISNNIANASTIGYKSRKPIFFNIFSHSFYSNSTKGNGVGISNIVQNFNNGMLVETGRDLDLGIIEEGFFRVLDSQGNIHYTRDGQFLLDRNKNIINMQGMYLTGKNISHLQNTLDNSSNLTPINLRDTFILKEKPTSSITLKTILNSNTDLTKKTDNSNENVSESKDYKTYFNIYNKAGKKEKIEISFNKIKTNTWMVNIKSQDFINNSNKKNIDTSFELKFNSNGELTSDKIFNIKSENSKYENITLNLTDTIEQSDVDNSWEQYSQDGHSKGSLKAFNISPNGEIIGTYSNEEVKVIGQILLSKFINPEKLQPESGNLWSATRESGKENIGMAGSNGFGFVTPRTLEASNVDLNKELINMIIAQRNYQSNAQSFKTEDKIISTLINLR
ncbi:flagellar hook protein FlgE [Buchnera aphidicola (Hyperomyzus lactucae)]|uniref:Flagellar hook protein FlgE n=1 Tax=Buchnera aphidicola (Hyperomyzus lactucae) TaxID=1241860 RepID=A0A4D6Y4Y1_9GAMM|nr:flagellar hook protein FlgE [Buchnera aphidicola]QCI21060.1 flagellar hook protein FlgE [Buchnera aphidicola (Hyperomyzus lactucae)]